MDPRTEERRENRLTLDPLTEIETLQTENDYLREKLALAEAKLRASISSLLIAQGEVSKLESSVREERRLTAELISEFEAATKDGVS